MSFRISAVPLPSVAVLAAACPDRGPSTGPLAGRSAAALAIDPRRLQHGDGMICSLPIGVPNDVSEDAMDDR